MSIFDETTPTIEEEADKRLRPLYTDFQSNIRQATEEKYVPTLYHYTSLDAFVSIMESKRLWCSDIQFQNDTTELTYGLEMSEKALRDAVRSSGLHGEKQGEGMANRH